MRNSRIKFIAYTLAISAIIGASHALAADEVKGKIVAERWCASCHAVSNDQARASADAPSFASIAEQRRIPEIKGFLTQSHPAMPDMSLTTAEITDLIAYMQTLGQPLDPMKPPVEPDKPPKEYRG